MNLLDQLNKEQRKAVQLDGVVVIIAGPGTGKTKTLISRIVYLIQEKAVAPEEILALTFTQKAVAEMKERLSFLENQPYISTFHALAFNILKQINETIEIVSENEREVILQTILEKQREKYVSKKSLRDLLVLITRYKNNFSNENTPSFIQEYNQQLIKRGLCDYDDLLLQLHELLITNDPAVTQYKKRFKYVLVDEFQDTNRLQYEIMKMLLNQSNLFVIGDPLQSIYSFRGADATIFDKLNNDFPEHSKIVLTTNYRSTSEIIHCSSSLFSSKIQLNSSNSMKGEVCIVKTVNEYTEADWIVNQINQKIGGTDLLKAGALAGEDKRKTRFSDFAVIYRTHFLSRILEEKFINSGIPYQVIGENSPFKQAEIAFMVNILEYLADTIEANFKKTLYTPVLQVSSKTSLLFSKFFSNNKKYNLKFFYKDMSQHIHSKKDMKILSTFISELERLIVEAKNIKLQYLIHKICNITCLKEYLIAKHINPKNIHTFMSLVTQFYEKKESLKECAEYLVFLKEHEFYDKKAERVTLLTMHASKGLEFKYVYICGFEDGIIPYTKELSEEAIQEEKRLLYVGMTRAKEGLYLLSPQERNKEKTIPSRFYTSLQSTVLQELQDEAIVSHEKRIKKWKEKKSQLQLF